MAPLTTTDVIAQGKYLEPGFDPTKLTIPVLLGVLHYHNVTTPGQPNKAALVRAFQDHIAPHTVRLGAERLARQGSQASDEGILDGMTGRQVNPARKSEAARTSKEPTKRKRGVKAKREESSDEELVPLNDADEVVEDSEPEDAMPRALKGKRRVSSGRRLSDLSGSEFARDSTGEWSTDNPFQRGPDSSSPPQASASRKRTSVVTQQHLTTRKSTRPEPEDLSAEDIPAPPRRTSTRQQHTRSPPKPRTPSPEEDDDAQQDEAIDELEAAEEMNQSFLNDYDAQNAAVSKRILDNNLSPYAKPAKDFLSSTPASVLILVLLAFSGAFLEYYKFQAATIGYCDAGSNSNAVLRAREAQRASAAECSRRIAEAHRTADGDTSQVNDCTPLSPIPLPRPKRCTPCPQHAKSCTPNGTITCENGYIPQSHPLSHVPLLSSVLDGLPGLGSVALPSHCVVDTRKKIFLHKLKAAIELYLAERRGERVCQGTVSDNAPGGEAQLWGIPVSELKDVIKSKMPRTTAEGKLDDDFNQAVSDLLRENRIVTSITPSKEKYIAAHRAELTLSCALRVRTRQMWYEWRGVVFGILATIAGLIYGRSWLVTRARERARVAGLVQTALDALRTQEFDHHTDPATTRQPYLSPLQLRDWVLQDEHSVSARKRLWNQVEKVVETNANVRANVEETDGGEETRVWRWVGSSAPRQVKYETPRRRIVA